jgi:hypothetical protein
MRDRRRGTERAVTLAALLAALPGPVAAGPPVPAPVPPAEQPPVIRAPEVPPAPSAGRGRVALVVEGNRRWCTFPDDRVMRPPSRPVPPGRASGRSRDEVHTFGYQFVVAAVKRGAAESPLMLFESPLFRTATWRPASKVGQTAPRKPKTGQVLAQEGTSTAPSARRITPDTLVPYWNDTNRCATLPPGMDFDLEPGTYDLYIAFDLLNREGGWVHRSTAYITDVPVQAGARTRVDGRVNMAGGGQREVELLAATLEPDGAAGTSGP